MKQRKMFLCPKMLNTAIENTGWPPLTSVDFDPTEKKEISLLQNIWKYAVAIQPDPVE